MALSLAKFGVPSPVAGSQPCFIIVSTSINEIFMVKLTAAAENPAPPVMTPLQPVVDPEEMSLNPVEALL